MKRKQADSDRIDDLLLAVLREDSRASNTSTGTRLGLSESAARRRVENLRSSGRIRRFAIEADDRHLSSVSPVPRSTRRYPPAKSARMG